MANQLEGVEALTRQLNELGVAVAAKELRGTARAAMKIVHQQAAANMPVGTVVHTTYKGRRVFGGFSKRNLRLVTRINKRTGAVEAIVGPSREAFYATQFVELGTAKMPARPWLRPAFMAKKDAVLSEITTQLRKRIKRIERKARR